MLSKSLHIGEIFLYSRPNVCFEASQLYHKLMKRKKHLKTGLPHFLSYLIKC